MHPEFRKIDEKRQALGMSYYALCRKAEVNAATYWRLKTEGRRPSRRTLASLSAALEGKSAREHKATPDQLRAFFNVVLAVCAQATGLPNLDTIAVDPHANRPRDLNWIAMMRVRQVAIYVVNTETNVRAADLARALGVSKQAISKALRVVEDRRDEPAFNRLLSRIGELMSGDAA